jgi:hypothetical protein
MKTKIKTKSLELSDASIDSRPNSYYHSKERYVMSSQRLNLNLVNRFPQTYSSWIPVTGHFFIRTEHL